MDQYTVVNNGLPIFDLTAYYGSAYAIKMGDVNFDVSNTSCENLANNEDRSINNNTGLESTHYCKKGAVIYIQPEWEQELIPTVRTAATKVYPAVFTDMLHIEMTDTGIKDVNVSLIRMDGTVVCSKSLTVSDGMFHFDTQDTNMTSGGYILSVTPPYGQEYRTKVIKK